MSNLDTFNYPQSHLLHLEWLKARDELWNLLMVVLDEWWEPSFPTSLNWLTRNDLGNIFTSLNISWDTEPWSIVSKIIWKLDYQSSYNIDIGYLRQISALFRCDQFSELREYVYSLDTFEWIEIVLDFLNYIIDYRNLLSYRATLS